MISIYCSPSRYVQGPNATASLGSEMSKLGLTGNTFILSGKSAKKHLTDIWEKSFSEASIAYKTCLFAGECSKQEIERVKTLASQYNAKVIVGAGGGKVLDTARAVASELDLPVVNCPTVASSDAPCSALSVVYKENGEFDSYFFYKRNPDLVLVDSQMVARAPKRLLVAGMGDALATWFEARTVREARVKNQVGGLPTKSATYLAKLCYETLLADGPASLEALESKTVSESLENLIEANTLLSGLGFESGGLAVAHSVHNGLTIIEQTHDYYHGEKVAFGTLVQLVMEKRPQNEIDQVIEFARAVGLPICLSQVGIDNVSTQIVEKIAKRTVSPEETCHNEPFPVTLELVAESIVAADKLGQARV